MPKVTGDIAITVGADISPLQKNMNKARGSVKGFGSEAKEMSKNFVKAGAAVAAAAAAMATALIATGRNAAGAANEINNLATIANAGTTEFQRMAAATDTVNISQEKLADILKDMNDRVGDFLATGGGPMKDFFEQIAPAVGVTADQFARLSGPEALQLYVSSLEKANVSQQKMTFYMEAIASDSTALLPLLKNNGQALRDLGDEAERAGRILSEDAIAAGVELDRELKEISATIETSFNQALLENKDLIIDVATFISEDLIPAISSLVSVLGDVAGAASSGIGKLREFYNVATGADGGGTADQPALGASEPPLPSIYEDISGTGTHGLEEPLFEDLGSDLSVSTAKSGGGGGRRGPSESDLEKLRDMLKTEREILQDDYQNQLDDLNGFLEQKQITQDEYQSLERELTKKHLETISEMEKREQQARLTAWQGALGDLSSLMSSNNEKLFKVGKAAALAEAIVSGYQAATDAWQKGMKIGGPPVAAAFTAMSLARTGAMIDGIRSQQIGGAGSTVAAGGGGGSAGGGNTIPAQQQAQSQQVQLTLIGDNGFTAGQIEQVANALVDRGDQGTLVIRRQL